MSNNQIKFFVFVIFTLSLLAAAAWSMNNHVFVSAAGSSQKVEDAAGTYKSKCAVCHGAKAEKLFDLAKKDDEHIETILKGKKAAKPPHMPDYESKGVTRDNAKDLVAFMRNLRDPQAVNTETVNTDAKDAKAKAIETTKEKSREAIIAIFKKNCAACHSVKAEKFYNPETSRNEQVQIILKGKKAAKPPHMPAYEGKGMAEEEATALAAYMMELRTPE